MRLPGQSIPERVRSADSVLSDFLGLMDESYQDSYQQLKLMMDLVDTATAPDDLLSYLLWAKGHPDFEGYTAQQRRDILTALYTLDSQRYTPAGLSLFIETITPAQVVTLLPTRYNFIQFRYPTISFPNSLMRITAGRETGDTNSYLTNAELLAESRIFRTFLFLDNGGLMDRDYFDFVVGVTRPELPDLEIELCFAFYLHELEAGTVTHNSVDTLSGADFTGKFTASRS